MISLCMIARNESSCIGRCLTSVRDVVDEIIVLDTGSTDETTEIARRLGAKVFHHSWNDDFSEARNRSLEHATGDWILVLDADETIARRDLEKIRALARGNFDGYRFTYRSYSQNSHDMRWVANDRSYEEGNGWDGWIPGRVVRMFKRDARFRFVGAVHERIDQSIVNCGGTIATADIILHHFHEEKGEARLREKQLHYLRLCEKNLARDPQNAKTHFDMGIVKRYIMGEVKQAIEHQRQALKIDPSFEDARMELALLHHLDGDSKAAARELGALLERNPGYAAGWLLCGIMLEKNGKLDRAIECYERAVQVNPSLIDARISLGTLRFKTGDVVAARNEWEHAHKMNPSNAKVLLNLGALELRDGNLSRARELLERALRQAPDSVPLWNNMGVLHARMGHTDEALAAFEKALALDPSRLDTRRNIETIRTAACRSTKS
ncbi:MAG: hypothetical protein Kow0099_25190 [Candidatus Abyssubacteria bacterium]